MITVNNNIKNAYNQSTTQTDRIKMNSNYYYINNVEYSDDCYEEGNIFGTAIARILTFEIESSIQMEKKEFQYETGVLINGIFEFVSLGNFIVTETEEGDTTDITKVTAMDYMLKTNTIYETNLNYANATLVDVLQEACTNCGLLLATTTFTNSSFRVDSNQFEKNTLNRQVIQAVAQVSGCIAKIKSDNKLYLINPNQIEDVSQVFTLREYSEADIKRLTHPLNLVSLANSQIEGENITMRDEQSIERDGENSLIIYDNPFAYNQDKRTQLITPLFNAVKGFEYKSYSFKFQMLPWIETLDKVQFLDKNGNIYNSYVFRFNYKSPNGVESTIEAPSETRATIAYQNIPDALEIAKRTEILVDKQNQIIESVVSNVTSQNNKISQVQQTVDELNSKISDIADITTSQESNSGSLTFEDINESEPIHVEIMPLGDNISYLYPFEQLYPADNLYIKLRTLRFTNTETNEVFDYELPDDLLFYDNEHYDKFILDYDSQTCYINKKCAYDNNGNVVCLADEVINSYTFPHINLTDGNYTVQILKYDGVPYGAYLFCRLMSQNIYTTQFATKAELKSEISQTTQAIDLSVNQKLTSYSTTSQMNSAISVKANEITSEVSETYETKNNANTNYSRLTQTSNSISATVAQNNTKANIIAKINDNTSSAKIDADVIELTANDILNLIAGNTINLSSKNITISSDTTKITGTGQKFFNNGTEIGRIGTNQYEGDNNQKGLTFDLDPSGRYMAWAKKKYSSDSSYIVKLYYCDSYSFGKTEEGVYLGTNLYANGNRIYGKRIYLDNGMYIVDGSYSGSGEKIFKISDNGSDVAIFSNGQNKLFEDLYIKGYKVQTSESDGRLKHDIQSSEINAVDRIMQMKHRMFKWNKDNKEELIGYIAQELEDIDSNYVIKNPQYDEKGEVIDYLYQVNILPILSTCTKAIQELKDLVSEQNKEINELKEENSKYKNFIEQIVDKLDMKEEYSELFNKNETAKVRKSIANMKEEKIDYGDVIQYSRNVIENKENIKILTIDKDGIVREEEQSND